MSIDTLNSLFTSLNDLENLERVSDYVELSQAYIKNKIGRESQNVPVPPHEPLIEEIEALKQSTHVLNMKTHNTREQVQSMTQDIKKLDRTKSNLVTSVTVLKRLQMLTKLHSQLDSLLAERQYRQLAQTLDAATELSEFFRDYRTLPHVAQLSQQVADQQLKISRQATLDVKNFLQGKTKSSGDLAWACRAISADQKELVGWYTKHALQSYADVFSIGSEAAGLDNVDRRYAMLRNTLNKHMGEIDKAFPREWQVGVQLAQHACDMTERDISLLQFNSGNSQSVQDLLDALQQTTEFEAYLRRRFPENAAQFQSPISRAFTPHLNIWVDFHEKTLAEKLSVYRSHEWNEEPEESADVFASSADIFLYYRDAMNQMAKLTTGLPLANLSRVFAQFLGRYAQLLRSYLPGNNSGGSAPGTATAEEIALSGKILKTADYCISTTSQLETTIVNMVDDQYKDDISFDAANEQLLGVIRSCLDVFVDQVKSALRIPWREMANVNWSRLQHAGDQSLYVNQLCMTIKLTTDTVVEALTKPSHRRMICDRIVEHVSLQFLAVVMTRAKPVSEIAAEQLLLDLYSVKAVLIELLEDQKYRENTTRVVARVENVLKVLLTQQEPPEGLTRNYLLLVKDSSVANFRKVLEAKGIRFQAKFVDLFKEMSTQVEDHDLPPLSQISMSKPPQQVTTPPPEPMSKFSENFKRIGGFLRRDTPNASPLLR